MDMEEKVIAGILVGVGVFFLFLMVMIGLDSYLCYKQTGLMSCEAKSIRAGVSVQIE